MVEEKDMLDEALKKQDQKNADKFAGMSMAEIAAAKRKETEEAIEAAKAKGVPSESEVEQRKARLRAQRDALRKVQEEKRQKELADFNVKTETKSDLFTELKNMDANLK